MHTHLQLMTMSPFAVKCLLRSILANFDDCSCLPSQFKLFHLESDKKDKYAGLGIFLAPGLLADFLCACRGLVVGVCYAN